MPSFVCDVCQETLKKAKLDGHKTRCRLASFSCIDCYKTFKGDEYRAHTECITEIQKYHGKPTNSGKSGNGGATPDIDKGIISASKQDKTRRADAESDKSTKKPKIKDELLVSLGTLLKESPLSWRDLRKRLKERGLKKDFERRCQFSVASDRNSISVTLL